MEEESRSLNNNASTSAAPYPVAEGSDMDESEDGDEEMILVIFMAHKYLVYCPVTDIHVLT